MSSTRGQPRYRETGAAGSSLLSADAGAAQAGLSVRANERTVYAAYVLGQNLLL